MVDSRLGPVVPTGARRVLITAVNRPTRPARLGSALRLLMSGRKSSAVFHGGTEVIVHCHAPVRRSTTFLSAAFFTRIDSATLRMLASAHAALRVVLYGVVGD